MGIRYLFLDFFFGFFFAFVCACKTLQNNSVLEIVGVCVSCMCLCVFVCARALLVFELV